MDSVLPQVNKKKTMSEFNKKQEIIGSFMERHNLEALLLQQVSSFAWATCGASSYINTAASEGTAKLLITKAGRFLFTNNIEASRLEQEESLKDQGWEFVIDPWFQQEGRVEELAGGLKTGSDSPHPSAVNLGGEIARLRSQLLPEEGQRFLTLGKICAEAMDEAVRSAGPGKTEYEIAGLLARATESRGAQAIVNLIATDDRIFKFRHPLPTKKVMERYAMLVLCGRKWGLVCSITRLVHFGRMDDSLRRKMEAVAEVDAAMICATRPGKSMGEVFQKAEDAYAGLGFPDEWNLHHQGGPAGYEPREYLGLPGSGDIVSTGQAYAWNPSITGVKSEDTILVSEKGRQILTEIRGWPMLGVSIGEEEFPRPAILEIG
jgi:Xaa-Pro aminopeptidase